VALVAEPTLAEAAYNLGSLYDDLGNVAQATLWYRRALEIRPDYADAHFNLASALERAGDGPNARRHWSRYLELDPDSRWAEIARAWVNGEGS
jgi:tetratricopeptide (TPR) repeat protein